MGEHKKRALRVQFDRRLKLEFHGAKITSDGGILIHRELDEALGLMAMTEEVLHDKRKGKNKQHTLTALMRQATYSRLVGYEDSNDAERLRVDPSMRRVVGGRAKKRPHPYLLGQFFLISVCLLTSASTLLSGSGNAAADSGDIGLANMEGLALWLKADSVNGKADGDPLAVWRDSSYNSWYAAYPTPFYPPPHESTSFTYEENVVNGQPVVRGTNWGFFEINSISELVKGYNDYTILAVLADDGRQKQNHIMGYWSQIVPPTEPPDPDDPLGDPVGEGHQWYLRQEVDDPYMRMFLGAPPWGAHSTWKDIPVGDTNFHINAWTREFVSVTNNTYTSYYDGSVGLGTFGGGNNGETGAGGPGGPFDGNHKQPSPTDTYHIAGYTDLPDSWGYKNFFLGDMAELIVFNKKVLSTDEHNYVGHYLEQKYGLNTAYVDPGGSFQPPAPEPTNPLEYQPVHWWHGNSVGLFSDDGDDINAPRHNGQHWNDFINPGARTSDATNSLIKVSGSAVQTNNLLGGRRGVDMSSQTLLYQDVDEMTGDMEITLFFVGEISNPGGSTVVHPFSGGNLGSAGSGWALQLDAGTDKLEINIGGGEKLSAVAGSAPWEDTDGIVIISLTKYPGQWGDTTTVKVNGEILSLTGTGGSGVTPNITLARLRLGGNVGEGVTGPAMKVGDFLIFDYALTQAEGNAVCHFLELKYRLDLNEPSSG